MQRRLPKRGFTPLHQKDFVVVNIGQLNDFDAGSTVDIAALMQCGLVSKVRDGIKVLAKGELTKSLTVQAHKFSESAKAKIEAAGGTVQEIELA